MADKELEKIIKVNDENKIEIVKIEERISNEEKEKAEVVKTIENLGIAVDEAEIILENSEEEYEKLIIKAKTKLGVE